MVHCPMPPLVLGEDDLQQLQALANSRLLPPFDRSTGSDRSAPLSHIRRKEPWQASRREWKHHSVLACILRGMIAPAWVVENWLS